MALPNSQLAKNPDFLHLYKNQQTNCGRKTYHFGCWGRTERLSNFVDKLLQPIAQQPKSYLKDTTNLINFIEGSKVLPDTTLVALDVTSFYTNIPQEEGIITVCKAYERFHNYNPPIPSLYLKDMLCLILQENSFQFRGNNFFRTHGTAMGTKMPVFIFLILEHIFLNSNTYFCIGT